MLRPVTVIMPRVPSNRTKAGEQAEGGSGRGDSDETIQGERPKSNVDTEEDGWKLSKRTGKMFHMEPDSDETKAIKTEVVVQHEIRGVVTSAFLNSEYPPTLHLECTRTEIESLEQFFRTSTIYNTVAHRDAFLLPFSRLDLTVKFRNNDPKWKGVPFTNIQDKRGQDLEAKDITTGTVVSVCCSPFLYEMRSKDKRGSTNREDYQPDGCSLRMDDITLIEVVDQGSDFESPKNNKSCRELSRSIRF